MTYTHVSESFHLFPCIYTKCQQILDNFPRYPKKIEYPDLFKGKGIRKKRLRIETRNVKL